MTSKVDKELLRFLEQHKGSIPMKHWDDTAAKTSRITPTASISRSEIKLTCDTNCLSCKGTGWWTREVCNVPASEVIYGPGGQGQYSTKSGLCWCIQPIVCNETTETTDEPTL